MIHKDCNENHIITVTDKPKIRKYNKKLKNIEDEETIIQLEEKLKTQWQTRYQKK